MILFHSLHAWNGHGYCRIKVYDKILRFSGRRWTFILRVTRKQWHCSCDTDCAHFPLFTTATVWANSPILWDSPIPRTKLITLMGDTSGESFVRAIRVILPGKASSEELWNRLIKRDSISREKWNMAAHYSESRMAGEMKMWITHTSTVPRPFRVHVFVCLFFLTKKCCCFFVFLKRLACDSGCFAVTVKNVF